MPAEILSADVAVMALAAAVSGLSKYLYPALKAYLKQRSDNPQISIDGQTLKLEGLNSLSEDQLRILLAQLSETAAKDIGTLRLSREAAGHEPSFQAPVQEPKREVAAVALAVGKEAIFQDARRRVELVFKLNLAIAIVLAIILLSGIAGAVFSAFFQRAVWATAFGGIAAADMIGVYVFKPLDAINSAMVASQRLDATALRLYEQLRSCDGYENLKDRIECQSVVWDKIQQELSSLAGPKK